MEEIKIENPVLTIEKYKEWLKKEFGVTGTPTFMSFLDDGYVVQEFNGGSLRVTLLNATSINKKDLVIIDCVVCDNGKSYRGIEPADMGL